MFGRRFTDHCRLASVSLAVLFTVGNTALGGEVFGTKSGKVYHTHPQDCASARKIQSDNKVTYSTEQEAKNAGRRLCKRCETLDRKGGATGPETGEGRKTDEPPRTEPPAGDGPEDSQPQKPPRLEPPAGPIDAGLPEFAAVTKVLSGGTLVLDNGETAALVGVACPLRGQPQAAEAARFMTEQTRGRNVRLAFENGGCRAGRRDELGRLLVYAAPEPDGRDLGGELIFQGYAWADRGVPFERSAEYFRFEEQASRAARGIWSPGENGGETVVTGRHARCYHAPNCEHVKLMSSVMNLTLDEAKARRLVPCCEYRGKK